MILSIEENSVCRNKKVEALQRVEVQHMKIGLLEL